MNNELIERIDSSLDGSSDESGIDILEDCKAEIERLTKALEAKPVGEPVAWMQTDLNGKLTNLFYNNVPEDDYHTYRPLYTAPPSVQALIADIDAIVTCAEIVEDDEGVRHYIGEAYAHDEVQAILDKYRGVK